MKTLINLKVSNGKIIDVGGGVLTQVNNNISIREGLYTNSISHYYYTTFEPLGYEDFTLSYWVKFYSTSSNMWNQSFGQFVTNNVSPRSDLVIWVNTGIVNTSGELSSETKFPADYGQIAYSYYTNKGVISYTGSSLNSKIDGNWHHIAICRHGTRCIGWLDGQLVVNHTVPSDSNFSNTVFHIGNENNSNNRWVEQEINDLFLLKGKALWTETQSNIITSSTHGFINSNIYSNIKFIN